MYYISTDFGADSSNRFPFRARTNRQTDRQTRLNALPHAGGYRPTAGVGNYKMTENAGLDNDKVSGWFVTHGLRLYDQPNCQI